MSNTATIESSRAGEIAAAPRPRILCAMSGGVDSAVAALLLHEQGNDVVGVHMATSPHARTPEAAARFRTCCSPRDAADARSVATREGFAFFVLDLEREFHDAVIRPFVDDYLHGRTPNPCVLCNNKLKLGHLLDHARTYGAEAVATGHYARCEHDDALGQRVLRRPVDRDKDQTYYLFGLTRAQVQAFRCPLGALTKPEVRALAKRHGLRVHDKPDSQEICFVTDDNYRNFLRREVPEAEARIRPGEILDEAGRVVGCHTGTPNYTIGQRRGLGIASAAPLYVLAIDPEQNVLVVGPRASLMKGGLVAERVNWQVEPVAVGAVRGEGDTLRLRCRAQIRYRATAAPCVVEIDRASATIRVTFDEPQAAVTPGQAVALYDAATGDSLLGGGWIATALAAEPPAASPASSLDTAR